MKRGLSLLPFVKNNPNLFKYLLHMHGARAIVWAYALGGSHWDGNLNVNEVISGIDVPLMNVVVAQLEESFGASFLVPQQETFTETINTINVDLINIAIPSLEEEINIGEIEEEE